MNVNTLRQVAYKYDEMHFFCNEKRAQIVYFHCNKRQMEKRTETVFFVNQLFLIKKCFSIEKHFLYPLKEITFSLTNFSSKLHLR